MPGTIRIRRHLDSDTIHVPEASELVGRDVEILIRELDQLSDEVRRTALYGSVLRYDDPFEPIDVEDWEALG
jgi:hypothetical protein